MEVKQRALEAQLFQRSYDQPQYLTFNHTPQDLSQGSCVIEIPRSPSACKASSYRKEEFLGNEGRAPAMLAFGLSPRMIEKG